MASIIANPIAHLDKVGPPVKKLTRAQKGLARRIAKFDAQRAQEGQMGLVMQDMNPGAAHQTKANFKPGKTTAPPAPPQSHFTPPPPVAPRPSVQRVARQLESTEPSGDDLGAELEAEFGQYQESAHEPQATEEADTDVDAILKRYKGSPEEIAKQIAKSYSESKKRMQHLEAEKQILLKGQTAVPQPQAQPVPQTQQLQVQPQFNYKRFKDDILDNGDKVAQDFEQHVTNTLDQKIAQVAAPLYEEAMDNRLFRKFGDVVTEDNLDLIKAMAHTAVGNNRWEKMVSAVQQYKTSMPTLTPQQLPEVTAMQQAAQTPSPQARTSGEKKMYTQSALQELMQKKMKTGEWQRDPKWSNLVNAAYRDGRVLRGQ